MKKLLVLSIGALALVANLSSCKKGENDPFLSLKSRKARLTGEWTVTKIEGTSSDKNSSFPIADVTSTTTYDGTTETTTTTTVMGTDTDTETYTLSFVFDKDGTYTQTKVEGTTTEVETGNWIFLGKNKTAEIANKEAIQLNPTSTSSTTNGVTVTSSSTGFTNSKTLMIDQLKSKEIVLIDSSSNTSGSQVSTDEMKITLTAKWSDYEF